MSTSSTLSEWLATSQGNYLLTREQAFFDQSVADIFGYNALQMGLPQHGFLHASRMPLRILASHEPALPLSEQGVEQAVEPRQCARVSLDLGALPFECDSLDLVLLPHTLEFSPHPHQILREVERVLRPEGSLIISAFNPRSLWGIRRALGPRTGAPWDGTFIALPRLKDWLALLGFEVVAGRFSCYVPPLSNPKWLQRTHFMEAAGDRWWAVCGGVYFLQAIKRVPGMTLIKPAWNEGLMGKLLPSVPKLNREVSQRSDNKTECQ